MVRKQQEYMGITDVPLILILFTYLLEQQKLMDLFHNNNNNTKTV